MSHSTEEPRTWPIFGSASLLILLFILLVAWFQFPRHGGIYDAFDFAGKAIFGAIIGLVSGLIAFARRERLRVLALFGLVLDSSFVLFFLLSN